MNDTIHMVGPVSAPERRTRLNKQVDVLLEMGLKVVFAGWERVAGEATPPEGSRSADAIERHTLLKGGGYGGRKTLTYYPRWSWAVFNYVRSLPRDAVVFCLGFETAAPALLASAGTRRRILFDDADRMSMSFPFPAPVRKAIAGLEKLASHRADVHVVPGFERYGWKHERMAILRNTPSSADFAAARELDLQGELGLPPVEDAFTIYANGWVGETRGAPVLLSLMQKLEARQQPARLLVIGRGDGDSFDRLALRGDVHVFGEMPQRKALAGYTISDLLFTFYDPRIPINRLAASNKWGDAIYLDTPFVVNSEVETARHFTDTGAGFAVDYDDTDALADLVVDLARNPARLEQARKALHRFREDYIPFDQRLGEIADRLRSSA